MSSKRHSLPSSFEHRAGVDVFAKNNDFEVLKDLKQLPFDEGDFSLTLPYIVRSLEQFAPPPLALPKNWLGKTAKDNAPVAPNLGSAPLSRKNGGDTKSSKASSLARSTKSQTETCTSASGAPLPNPKMAELPSASASSPSPDVAARSPKTSSVKEPAASGPGSGSPRHQRQLSATFVRGQRLPFSIVEEEEEEEETSESCYSTEDGPTSSDSQHAEADGVSPQQSQTQSSSVDSGHANQSSSTTRPSRAHVIRDRMKRVLGSRALSTRVRD